LSLITKNFLFKPMKMQMVL